jgi:type III pantothenate kinase
MQLLIDVGNTRVKWLLLPDNCDDSYPIDSAQVSFGLLLDLTKYIDELQTNNISVSVAAVNQSNELIALLDSYSFRSVFYAKTTAQHLGLVNSYSLPERMGVDRWLAMIAGYSALQSQENINGVIIVDAGSALTVDVVANDGMHLGGYIVPGLLMAKKALFANTERVINYDETLSAEVQNDKLLRLGNNTMQCVDYGIINQMIALIQMVVSQYDRYQLVLTGGDSDLLAEFFATAIVDKNLVLKGLWQVRE